MIHLKNTDLQLLADGEGTASLRAHVDQCVTCQAKLDERSRAMAQLTRVASTGEVPDTLVKRIETAVRLAPPSVPAARGATVLRPERSLTRRPLWATALAVGGAIAIVAFFILPRVDAPVTLSAAQVIDRSIERMIGHSGVEELEYELVLASSYRRSAGLSEGPYRIVQVFDRANPARFKFQQFDAAGALVAATAQDPSSSRRTEMVRVDGRDYVIHVTSLPGPLLSIPALLQSQAEVILRVMQARADPHLQTLNTPSGPAYVVEIPTAQASASSAMPLDLQRARAVIDATDFRVLEFAAAGSLLNQPFDLTFRLLTQSIIGGGVPDDVWTIAEDADDVVISGSGVGEFTDSLSVALRELGKSAGR